jgi:hypothetical protein
MWRKWHCLYIVTYGPIAMEHLGKQGRNKYLTSSRVDPFLSNTHNNRTGVYVVRIYALLRNGCVFYDVIRPEAIWREDNNNWQFPRVEAGSNTSTVTLRVVGGDENGSLESETVKYGCESQGTRTPEWVRWRGPVAIAIDRPVLSSEGAPQINKPESVWQ